MRGSGTSDISALSDDLRAALRDTDLLAFFDLRAHARALPRPGVQRHHLAGVERGLDLEDSAGTLRRGREVFLDEVDPLDDDHVALGQDADDLALLALVLAAD